MNTLERLHAEIDLRVDAIRAKHPDWLCRRGCEGCCHRLAEIPRITEAEWSLLADGLHLLPEEQWQRIGQEVSALAQQKSRPVVCPLLDRESGACLVYLQRPVVCRTYGFYVQRDKGFYCKDIEFQVAGGALSDVVWGNQDVIDSRLKSLGEERELTEWFADWERVF